MLTVDDYARIRRAYRDGMSLREIARSRKKIREVLRGEGEPGSYAKRQQQVAPKLERFHPIILEILQQDEMAPPKQRHTRMRIFERLRDVSGGEKGDHFRGDGGATFRKGANSQTHSGPVQL